MAVPDHPTELRIFLIDHDSVPEITHKFELLGKEGWRGIVVESEAHGKKDS